MKSCESRVTVKVESTSNVYPYVVQEKFGTGIDWVTVMLTWAGRRRTPRL